MRNETPASIRIQKARTTLLLDHPFFGSLLFRLKGREQRSIPTMATDGESLYYNPEFVDTLNSATLAGVLAHEVMHPALQHHVRRSGRDPRRWNEACDYAINPLLLDAGLSLPDGVLVDHRFRGMSAEQIRQRLCGFTAQDLKKHDLLRVATANDAAEIVAEIDSVLRDREVSVPEEAPDAPTVDDILSRMSAYMEVPAAA